MTVQDAIDKFEAARPKYYEVDPDAVRLLANEGCWKELFHILRTTGNASELIESICKGICRRISLDHAWRLFCRAVNEGLLQFKDCWCIELYRLYQLQPTRWRETPAELKKTVIYELLNNFVGEPFKSIRDARGLGNGFGIGQVIVPPIGYIPHVYVRAFRDMVQTSGDTESLALIDELIHERRSACLVAVHHSSPRLLVLTSVERELVARLFGLARQGGFRCAPLPPIHLSDETPPVFLSYPELEMDKEETEDNGPIPRDRQRHRPETISIEELLGCYQADPPEITLWVRGIHWCASRLGMDEEMLRAVVLIHELGHWFMHRLPKPGLEEWPLSLYKLTHEDVHECWAQLQTWYVGSAVGGAFQTTFQDLNKHQSPTYRVWERFTAVSPMQAFSALESLRRLPWPARLEDWKLRVL